MRTLIYTLAILFVTSAHADQTRVINVKNHAIEYQIHEDVSPRGEREIIIDHLEKRPLALSTSVTVLVGRDLDGDGLFDAWFFMGNQGLMESVELQAKEQDGWDAAQVILKDHTKLENRWLAGIMLGSLAWLAPITHGHHEHLLTRLAAEEIELLDLGILTERMSKQNPRQPQLLGLYTTLADGWERIGDQASIKGEILAGVGDVALCGVLGAFSKLLGRLGPFISRALEANPAAAAAQEIFLRFSAGIKSRVAGVAEKIGITRALSGETLVRVTTNYAIMKIAVKERVGIFISALESRGKVGQLAADASRFGLDYVRGGMKQVPYIAWTQSLQLTSEVWERRKVLFSSDPLVLSEKIQSRQDLIHDLRYMTIETAVTSTIIHRNGNGIKGFAKAGVFSMVDSTANAYYSEGKLDLSRTGFDTGWEVVIGNSQTLFDQNAINLFENMGKRSNRPGLVLVGYLVAGVDQYVGYTAYAKALEYKKQKEEQKPIVLVPVLAPQN